MCWVLLLRLYRLRFGNAQSDDLFFLLLWWCLHQTYRIYPLHISDAMCTASWATQTANWAGSSANRSHAYWLLHSSEAPRSYCLWTGTQTYMQEWWVAHDHAELSIRCSAGHPWVFLSTQPAVRALGCPQPPFSDSSFYSFHAVL